MSTSYTTYCMRHTACYTPLAYTVLTYTHRLTIHIATRGVCSHTAVTCTLQHTGFRMMESHTRNAPSLQNTLRGVAGGTYFNAGRSTKVSAAILVSSLSERSRYLWAHTPWLNIFVCVCIYLTHFHNALIAAHVEKMGHRKCDCTRLQTTYANQVDISMLRYTPMINILHYVSTETLSREEIHMLETRTHKQCLPDYSTHWWACVATGNSVQYIMQHAAVTFTLQHTGVWMIETHTHNAPSL